MKLLPVSARLTILCTALLAGRSFAQPPPDVAPPPADNVRPAGPRMPGEGARTFRSPAGTRGVPLWRDPGSSGPLMLFRQFMRDEMKNVPLLMPRINELIEIQQQRNVLQKQRAQIADDRTLSPDESLRKFHDLLKREDDLNNRQKSVFDTLAHDAPQIQKQIAERRKQLQVKLQEIGPGEKEDAPGEAHTLAYAGRLYEFLENRVASLQANPDRVDLLNRFFKGMPSLDEPDRGSQEEARARLQAIMEEQDELSERMERLENEIRQLRQVLRSPGSGPQRWRGHNRDKTAPDRPTTGPASEN